MAHVAPLGLEGFCYPVCYKHIAPLELNEPTTFFPLRSEYTHQILYPENPDSDNNYEHSSFM